jgi:hypothetical protein
MLKSPSSKAAASEEARRTLRYVEPLSDARTPLADCFSILREPIMKHPAAAYSAEVVTSATKAGGYGVFGEGE